MKAQTIILRDDTQRIPFVKFLNNLTLEKPVEITIKDYRKKRSLSQLALYWVWVNRVVEIVADETGHSPEEIHTYFKTRFLTPQVIEIDGKIVNHYTTTKLTMAEMSAYMTQIYEFVTSTMGLYLPIPEDRQIR